MDQSQKKIFVHLGTFNGAIIGFEGNVNSLENIYAYTPNMVKYDHYSANIFQGYCQMCRNDWKISFNWRIR